MKTVYADDVEDSLEWLRRGTVPKRPGGYGSSEVADLIERLHKALQEAYEHDASVCNNGAYAAERAIIAEAAIIAIADLYRPFVKDLCYELLTNASSFKRLTAKQIQEFVDGVSTQLRKVGEAAADRGEKR